MKILKLCACGNLIEFSNEDQCENCFSLNAARYHGRSQRVKTHFGSKHEAIVVSKREEFIGEFA